MKKKLTKEQPDKTLERRWKKLNEQILSPRQNEMLEQGTAVATVALNIDQRFERKKQLKIINGRKSKRKEAIWEATTNMLMDAKGGITSRQAWGLFPESDNPLEFSGCDVFRDGERLYQTDKKGKGSSITYKTFRQNYFSPAKIQAQ